MYNNQGGSVDYTKADIVQNRDFYDSVGSFDGASGIGIGSSANRPSTCTTDVAYWGTDTSTLYQCNHTNSWTVYYQPYTYPHPLQGGGQQQPEAPTGLSAAVS